MRIVPVAVMAAALTLPALASAQSWTRLGNREVSDRVDHDSIRARGSAQYRQMIICVEQAPVHFLSVIVRYRDGTTQDVRLRNLIRAGACSRDIALRGRNRDIEAVDFTYETASLGASRARVEVSVR